MRHRGHAQNPIIEQPKEGETLGYRHHNFTIELFLDDVGEVSDIFIDDHDLSDKPEKINGWKPEKITDFIALHTGIQKTKPVLEKTSTGQISKMTQTKKQIVASKITTDITGTLHLNDLQVISSDSENPTYLLNQGQPFTVRFILDLTDLNVPKNVALAYEANIIANQPGYAGKNVGKQYKKIDPSKKTVIDIACTGLSDGMYRLGALVKLTPTGTIQLPYAGSVAFIEGGDFVEVI